MSKINDILFIIMDNWIIMQLCFNMIFKYIFNDASLFQYEGPLQFVLVKSSTYYLYINHCLL